MREKDFREREEREGETTVISKSKKVMKENDGVTSCCCCCCCRCVARVLRESELRESESESV